MKKCIILSGVPGAGKSTLCEEFKKHYGDDCVLSPDTIREMIGCIERDAYGNPIAISQDANAEVFKIYYQLMEGRMKRGATVVCDATHTSKSSLKDTKKLCEKYGYIVELHRIEVPLETLLRRNCHRGYKDVPKFVVERMYKSFMDFTFEDWYTVSIHKNG